MSDPLEEVSDKRREEAERKAREEAERLQQERREREAREEAAREQQARWADRFRAARSWLARILRDPIWQGIAGVIAIIAFIVTFVSMGGPDKVASWLWPTPTSQIPIPTLTPTSKTTPTSTRTPTSMPIQVPPLISTPADINNGDLETGDFTYWAHGGSYPQSVVSRLYNGELPYEGHYCIQLGEPVPCISQTASSAWMYQDFTVPNVPSTVTLSFSYRIFTNDMIDWADFYAELRAPNDALLVYLLHDGYDQPDRIAKCSTDLGWKTFSYNLEGFKGQTVRIYFASRNEWDGSRGLWTYVDAIYLKYAR